MAASIKQLKYLCAVAKTLHFGKAAQLSHVNQSTLSAGIQELERQLGVKILERNKQTVLITPLGEKLLLQARTILGEVEDFMAIAGAHQAVLSGDMRLGVIPTIGPFLLPQMLASLRHNYPSLKLYLHEDLTVSLVRRLQQGELDLLVLALPYQLPSMEVLPLFDDDFLLLLPPDHVLAKRQQVLQRDLYNQNLLLLEEGHCLRDHALEACKLGQSVMNLVYQGSSLHTLVQMVANGLGLTLLPEMAVHSGILNNTNLLVKNFKAEKVCRKIGLVWRKSDPRNQDYLLLGDFIKSYMTQLKSKAGENVPTLAHTPSRREYR